MPNDKMILIVEDNPDNRTLIKDVLDALDYGVLEATDGNEGVELALKHKPALILMDLSLPHKDGWEATREIKANADTAHTPIIALTAHAMVGDRERAIEAGCDDYVSKPINLMELNEKIRKHLAEKPASEDTKAKDESPAKPSSTV
jgi:two-component system, cell cycle response regulator DivK